MDGLLLLPLLFHVSGAMNGPRLLIAGVGDSVTIPCLYPKTPANRHDRKFWCKMSATKVCNTIISTNSYTSDEYKNRAEITDFPHNSTAMLRMTSLRKNDSGIYRCGIGVTNRGLFISVNLTVLDDPTVPKSPELVLGEPRGSVTIQCHTENVKGSERSFWCRLGKSGCSLIADTDGYVSKSYDGRIVITHQEGSGTFNVLINGLKPEDSGLYKCGTGTPSDSRDTETIDLQLTEDSTIPKQLRRLSGVVGGSVSATCRYDPQKEYEMKYWCKWEKAQCSPVVDTHGFVDDAFKGRTRIVSDNQKKGTYTIVMSRLREKDEGWYWCGAKGGNPEQTSSVMLYIENESQTSAPASPKTATRAKGAATGSAATIAAATRAHGAATPVLHSIPNHINTPDHTYPARTGTGKPLGTATTADRFVTSSQEAQSESSSSGSPFLSAVLPALLVLLLLAGIAVLIKVKLQKKRNTSQAGRNPETAPILIDLKDLQKNMTEDNVQTTKRKLSLQKSVL
ncbi:PREDICTED: polymeric immunoglobulin receptor-like isoform X2 [Crocodylus porosus]|uniref:polymeric immunoglobulin receptor-like isoform X2 n=1 Tax=Crocodylus porosus TaxID=8502 RepID=UPI00093A2ECF|nr:PREDICTED: polymeric immunoglobulin receptor-like isoform X2 [Crocodylus porosus]